MVCVQCYPLRVCSMHEATNSKNVCSRASPTQQSPFRASPKEPGLSSNLLSQLFGLTGHFPPAQMLCLLLCDCHQLFHPYSSKQTRIIQPLIQRSTTSLLSCSLSSEPKAGQIQQATCTRKPHAHQRLKSCSDFLERVSKSIKK